MSFNSTRTVYLSVMMTVMMTFALGCKENKNKIPGDAKGRMESMAGRLPASTEAAVFVGDVAKMRDTLNKIKDNVGGAVPDIEATQKQLTNELGFDPLDAAAWKGAGVPDKSGATIAFVNNRIAIMVFVEDRQKFDAKLAEMAKKATGAEAAPKTEDIDGAQVKMLGEGEEQIAWMHDGKLAIIGTSVLDPELGGEKSSPQKFVASLSKTKKEASAASTAQFKQFMKGVGPTYAVAAFANAKALTQNEAYKKNRGEMVSDPAQKQSVEWFEKHGEALGLGLTADGDELKLTAFFGADAETNKTVASFGQAKGKSPWGSFATKEVLLGTRSTLDLQKSWKYYMDNLPEEQKKQIQQGLEQSKAQVGLDIEEDIVANLSGHVGVFFYGLNVGGAMAGARDPGRLAQALNLAVGIQFKDAASLKNAVDKIKAKAGDALAFRPLKAGDKEVKEIQVFADPNGAFKVYLKDDLLIVGTKELSEQAAHDYLMGKSSEAKLADEGGALGKKFGSPEPYNGLYLNVEKLTTIASTLASGSPATEILKKLSEASLTFDANGDGMSADLRITLKSAGK